MYGAEPAPVALRGESDRSGAGSAFGYLGFGTVTRLTLGGTTDGFQMEIGMR